MKPWEQEAIDRAQDRARRQAIPIPTPPPPPAEVCPPGGSEAWARWQLRYTFSPDDAAILEWIHTWPHRHQRVVHYAAACHTRSWAGWQATLAWNVLETLHAPLDVDDDIPF